MTSAALTFPVEGVSEKNASSNEFVEMESKVCLILVSLLIWTLIEENKWNGQRQAIDWIIEGEWSRVREGIVILLIQSQWQNTFIYQGWKRYREDIVKNDLIVNIFLIIWLSIEHNGVVQSILVVVVGEEDDM